MKKIIISFDGTWNAPDSDPDIDGDTSTNVNQLHNAICDVDSTGNQQLKWYEKGVGTAWYNRIRGGVFGVGLSDKIQAGYRFLAENYEQGDSIYILGFSRGAYSARSLVGLIRNVGLLTRENAGLIPEAYSLYRTHDEGADTENAIYFRKKYSQEPSVKFLGVWDTVGSLGIPFESFKWFNKKYYEFHDTELSGIVENAFQALAIDEHRRSFSPTLWDPIRKPRQNIEQTWFTGAHSNVGGGYPDNRLSDFALLWMSDKIRQCGLAINTESLPQRPADYFALSDSYKDFLGGHYCKIEPRYYRDIGTTIFGNEIIDASVKDRTIQDKEYKPRNMVRENLGGDYTPNGKITPPKTD